MTINVICFLWGDWPEPGWGAEYVRRLASSVEQNTSVPYEFTCFTDDMSIDVPVRLQPLDMPVWGGCLPKLYAYNPDNGLRGRTLILDLDNVITGNIDPFLKTDHRLVVRGSFAKPRVPDGDMIAFTAGSPTARRLWETFSKDPKLVQEQTGGRERFFLRGVETPKTWQSVLPPGYVLSYKRHVKNRDRPPPDARIVSFHDNGPRSTGRWRPHRLLDVDWIRETWK